MPQGPPAVGWCQAMVLRVNDKVSRPVMNLSSVPYDVCRRTNELTLSKHDPVSWFPGWTHTHSCKKLVVSMAAGNKRRFRLMCHSIGFHLVPGLDQKVTISRRQYLKCGPHHVVHQVRTWFLHPWVAHVSCVFRIRCQRRAACWRHMLGEYFLSF